LTGAAEQQIFLTMTNKVPALDTAIVRGFHAVHPWRRASEFLREVISHAFSTTEFQFGKGNP
jgi:hypothetical protein